MSKITIDTDLGKVIGTEENGIRMFRGIPYAITERFELPKPYPAWDVFDATQTEIDCIMTRQVSSITRSSEPARHAMIGALPNPR